MDFKFNSCFELAYNRTILFQEEKMKEYRKEKRKDRKRKIDEPKDDDEGPVDEMAEIMGFSGFGSSKKK